MRDSHARRCSAEAVWGSCSACCSRHLHGAPLTACSLPMLVTVCAQVQLTCLLGDCLPLGRWTEAMRCLWQAVPAEGGSLCAARQICRAAPAGMAAGAGCLGTGSSALQSSAALWTHPAPAARSRAASCAGSEERDTAPQPQTCRAALVSLLVGALAKARFLRGCGCTIATNGTTVYTQALRRRTGVLRLENKYDSIPGQGLGCHSYM